VDDFYRQQAEAFAEFLLTLPKARRRIGQRVSGRCPLPEHEDKHPSFGYDIEGDMWACSCGAGKGSELRERLGFRYERPPHALGNGGKGERVLVSRHVYHDEKGKPLFRVNKYSPKKPFGFDQERWDEAGQRWTKEPKAPGGKTLDGVRRVLYRLPEILASTGPVIVVEGEKDADAGWELGYPSTTNPHGAGHWRDEYALTLTGREVILIADNDDIGKAHAEKVEASLKRSGADVRRLDLGGAKDLAEWVEQGGTPDAFRALIEAPPDFTKLTGAPIVRASEFLPEVEETVDYVMEPVLIAGGLTQLHGEPKSGKSCFALELAILSATHMNARGDLIQARDTGPVLYLAFEDGPRRLKRRILDYMGGLGMGEAFPTDLYLWVKPEIDVGTPQGMATLMDAIESVRARVVVLDTLSYVHRADENDASEMKIVMANLTRVARETSCAVLYVHHSAKGEGRSAIYKGRGSSAIVAAADVVLDWGRPANNVTRCEMVSKDDEGRTWDVHYQSTDEGVSWDVREADDGSGRPATVPESKVIETVLALFPQNQTGVSARMVAEATGMNKRGVNRALDRLVDRKVLRFLEGVRKTRFYLPL